MDYEAFRAFADTWGLLLLVIVFGAAGLFALRSGARDTYRAAAMIPMNTDEHGSPVRRARPDAGSDPAGQ